MIVNVRDLLQSLHLTFENMIRILLLAVRESVAKSLGICSFDFDFSHTVHGPLKHLK